MENSTSVTKSYNGLRKVFAKLFIAKESLPRNKGRFNKPQWVKVNHARTCISVALGEVSVALEELDRLK